jgi:hypothetical protein
MIVLFDKNTQNFPVLLVGILSHQDEEKEIFFPKNH